MSDRGRNGARASEGRQAGCRGPRQYEDEDVLLVGRIARAHGNRGQVIVNPESDFPEARFKTGHVLLVGNPAALEPREIREVRFHQGRPIVLLSGIESLNDAEALAGAGLWMSAAALDPLPRNTFYRHDLTGCEVEDPSGRRIGRVTGVEGTLDRSYLLVASPSGEVMVPLVGDFCRSVDIAARRIVVDLPEGLLELNATGQKSEE